MTYNIYLDESCHLFNDKKNIMSIGYIKLPVISYKELVANIKNIRAKNRFHTEIKWNKYSIRYEDAYRQLINFMASSPIEYSCILVKNKESYKDSDLISGTHDNFYYEKVCQLLKPNPQGVVYNVFLDIKSSRDKEKLNKIRQYFDGHYKLESPFIKFQTLRSEHNVFIQLADLFTGAIAYKNRALYNEVPYNIHREKLIEYIERTFDVKLNELSNQKHSKFKIAE